MEDVHAVLPETLAPDNPGLVNVSRPSDAPAAKRSTRPTSPASSSGWPV